MALTQTGRRHPEPPPRPKNHSQTVEELAAQFNTSVESIEWALLPDYPLDGVYH